jgi:alkylation response protein AidB-like acyl-CoA dehydrogenase
VDFEISEAQQELRDSVRAVLERECPIEVARARVEERAPTEQPWRAARELGWTGIALPESLGGLGLGFAELALVLEAHGAFLAPGPLLATVSQFAPLVREAGDEACRRRWLGAVAAGRLAGALAVANEAGSLAPDDGLRALREGSAWRLDGARHWVVDAESADEIALAARVAEGDGVALFCVPRAQLELRPVESLDATRPVASVLCAGVRVEPERVIGTPGACARALRRALEEATVALALDAVGASQRLFDLTLEYARQRKQFGQPIGSFQAIQHKLVDMFTAIEKARSLAYFAAMTLAEDDPRRTLAASMAKVGIGDCQRLVAKEAIQIHGGIGFTWECDVHLFVKRIKACESLLGTSAEHRARIADQLLHAS